MLILLAVVAVIVVIFSWQLFSPLPPPKVLLKFQGFTVRGTNTVVLICFTNEGTKSVWWGGSFKVTPETQSPGPLQNWSVQFSGWPSSTPPSSGFVMPLTGIPENYRRFWVSAEYRHYKKRPLRIEMEERLIRLTARHRMSPTFWKIAHWCLDRLPDPPKAEVVEISTPLITNDPKSQQLLK